MGQNAQGVFPPSRLVGRYVAKITQSGTAAPAVGTELENTLFAAGAAPALARTSAGVYTITAPNSTTPFTANKTLCRMHGVGARDFGCAYTSTSVITTAVNDLATPTAADSGNFDLEIEVYQ